MRPGWIIGLAIAFLLLHLVNGVCEMSYATGHSETIFNGLIEAVNEFSDSSNFFEGTWDFIKLVWAVIVTVYNMFWFDYAYLTGDWIFLRFIYMAISLGIIVSLILAMRGTSSA